MAETQKPYACKYQNWSDLPGELLQSIAKLFDTKIDVSRSRAVCKSWRFYIPPPTVNSCAAIKVHLKHRFRSQFRNEETQILTLTKNLVYHVAPPRAPSSISRGWLIRVREGEEDPLRNALIMLHPLSAFQLPKIHLRNPLLPKEITLFDFRVSELSAMYHTRRGYPVAVSLSTDFTAVMVIVEGKLYHCRLGAGGDVVPNCEEILRSSVNYEDAISHEGDKFFVVSVDGRTVEIDTSLRAKMIATPISAPAVPRSVPPSVRKMHLVESFGELLLVIYLASTSKCRHVAEADVMFEVFKLNAPEKKWVEMKTLDDRILFVGSNGCFSVLARDFPGCMGNCIYFYHPCSEKYCSYVSQPQMFSNVGVALYADIGARGGTDSLPHVYYLHDNGDNANIFCLPPDVASAGSA